jgi:hypothetical protein
MLLASFKPPNVTGTLLLHDTKLNKAHEYFIQTIFNNSDSPGTLSTPGFIKICKGVKITIPTDF